MTPYYDHAGITLYRGDCREILPHLGVEADVVIADPPYSSGGLMRSDRAGSTADKYRLTGTMVDHGNFSGDNRDQRAFTYWASFWAAELLERTRPGGALLTFIDWRNLPAMIDAVQIGGWVYRGIIPWDKTVQARPEKGWF